MPEAGGERARRAGAGGVPGRVWALPAVAVAVAGRAVKSRLADIGSAALIALAFVLEEIVAHKRLSAAVVALILAGLVLPWWRSEEHTSELQSLMRISYAVFCLKKKKKKHINVV